MRGLLALTLVCTTFVAATPVVHSEVLTAQSTSSEITGTPTDPQLNGWDYLVHRLRRDNVPEEEIFSVYTNPRMPAFKEVYFTLKPREPHSIYSGFTAPAKIKQARTFLSRNENYLAAAEKHFGVSRSLITAILLVETQLGKVTGKDLVINRLSRVASIGEPKNLLLNYQKLKGEDPSVTFQEVEARARYLEKTFYPEVPAVFEIARKRKVSILGMRGSKAGAFGMPQFLPTTYLRFGYHEQQGRMLSLYSEPDAIWATANFFAYHGWKNDLPHREKSKVIWNYNRSEPYVETVLKLADILSRR